MITIIILAYIANIFLNRWLNYKLWKINNHYEASYFIWFIPIVSTLAYIIVLLTEIEIKDNWFTGKYWK